MFLVVVMHSDGVAEKNCVAQQTVIFFVSVAS